MPNIMGSHWANLGEFHASAFVWIDEDTGKTVSAAYNLGDSTGDHKPSRPHAAAKPHIEAIRIMVKTAIVNATIERAYRLARRRDTAIESLKYAFLVTEGRGGHTIHSDESQNSSSTLQGYGLTGKPELLAEIDRLGIPYVDTRTVPDSLIAAATYKFPMWPNKPDKFDPAPWGGFSMAPVPIVAAMWAGVGATVRNIELVQPPTIYLCKACIKEHYQTGSDPDDMTCSVCGGCDWSPRSSIRDLKAWEKAGLRAYQAGDEFGVGLAMQAAREDSNA